MGMTIWILSLVLLASLAGLGYRQGAIRVAFSLVGILFGALLAGLLAKPIKLLLPHVGVHEPIAVWFLSPFIVFVIVLSIFKSAGFAVHRKVEVFYKHKASDLRATLFERLNRRLGLGLGLINGLLYIILLSFVIYDFSYWTVQIATSEDEPRSVRLLNQMGRDLQSTGLDKVARAIDPLPQAYFQAADFAGLLYQNPQLADRLSSYPAFLSLAERDDFKQLGQDAEFHTAWKNHSPVGQLINDAPAKAILDNLDTRAQVWGMVQTDLNDLTNYLYTGKSAKYGSEKILGRWNINVSATFAMVRQMQPNSQPAEMRAVRAWMMKAYENTTFVAGADGQAFLKNLGQTKGQPPATEMATWTGQWKAGEDVYDVTVASGGENKTLTAKISDVRLTLKDNKNIWVFERD
jgi:uncharacterized membrane protein required for colicin V production